MSALSVDALVTVAEVVAATGTLQAVTTVQVGALPMEGAQVIVESIGAEKKTVNPSGLAFRITFSIASQPSTI